MSEYAERDIIEQGTYYSRHTSAMTGEGLHSKSNIAAELAHRDIQIDQLRKQVETEAEVASLYRDERDQLRQQLEQAESRVAELERDNAHQRERRNAARNCIQKMKAESLRKQADAAEEAIVCALRTVGNVDPFKVNIHKFANDYAQRLRQQADEAERAGGEK